MEFLSKIEKAIYPLTPLETTLRMNHFWKSKNNIRIGIIIIEAKARNGPHRISRV
jgi:hypothetical protein